MLKRSFLYFLLIVSVAKLQAQTVTSSPYSRFGIGEVEDKIFSRSAALGGANIALQNDSLLPVFINPANPASYCSLKSVTAFEVGVNSIFNKFETNAAKTKVNNSTFNYLAIGFPIGKRMGGCLGVIPASSVGYNIVNYSYNPTVGTLKEIYTGDGGINQLYIGTGIQPFAASLRKFINEHDTTMSQKKYTKAFRMKRWLSSICIGGNANYDFGTINNGSRLVYPSQSVYFHTALTTQSVIHGFTGNFGLLNTFVKNSVSYSVKDTVKDSPTYGKRLHYKRNLKHRLELTVGYTWSLGNSLKMDYTDFAYTFLYQSNGINEYFRDTIHYVTTNNIPLTLAPMHGIGISLKKGTKLNFLADFQMQLWSKFSYINQSIPLQDMKRVSVGLEYIPQKSISTKEERFKRIQYRLGAFYSDGNMVINNTRVGRYGVTAGLGVPLGGYRVFNVLNVSGEFGQMGTITNDLVRQQYIRVKLDFTFNSRWFQKYKYD